MIGNDIVDLKKAASESNWKRNGFLEKIFTSSEQEVIQKAEDSNLLVWALWTMKEAAYKAYYRIHPVWEYAPTKIVCSNLKREHHHLTGKMTYHDKEFHVKTLLLEGFLHSIASLSLDGLKEIRPIELKDYPSDYWEYLKKEGFISSSLELKKDADGIPHLINRYTHLSYPVSISHHGKFFGMILFNDI